MCILTRVLSNLVAPESVDSLIYGGQSSPVDFPASQREASTFYVTLHITAESPVERCRNASYPESSRVDSS